MYIIQTETDSVDGTPQGPWTYSDTKPNHAPESFGELLERVHVSGNVVGCSYTSPDFPESGSPFDEDNDIPARCPGDDNRPVAFCPDHLTSGDYGGAGALGKANRKSLEDLCEDEGFECSFEQSGMFGSEFVWIPLGLCCAALNEFFEALADYPVADEELMSAIETEEQEESWESYTKSDVEAYLLAHSGIDLSELPEEHKDALWSFTHAMMDQNSTYWVNEQDGAYLDVEAALEGFRQCEQESWTELAALGKRDADSYDVLEDGLPDAPCFTREESPSAYAAYLLELATWLSLPTSRTLGELAHDIKGALPDEVCSVDAETNTLHMVEAFA